MLTFSLLGAETYMSLLGVRVGPLQVFEDFSDSSGFCVVVSSDESCYMPVCPLYLVYIYHTADEDPRLWSCTLEWGGHGRCKPSLLQFCST